MYYSINLPHLETFLPVTKKIFFELVDRLSNDFVIVKVPMVDITYFFVKKCPCNYEYLGFCIYEN